MVRRAGRASQIVSWIAFALSIFLAIAGFTLLKSRGRPQGHFEYTTALVTDGVYRYIRHPMYASLFLLAIWRVSETADLPAGARRLRYRRRRGVS